MKNRHLFEAAHLAYGKAKRDGHLVAPDKCSRCGAGGEIHGHHADYARPFDVEWLCRKCHHRVHLAAGTWRDVQPRIPSGTPVVVGPHPCAHCNGTGKTGTPRPLTALQHDLYRYLWDQTKLRGIAPSFHEIAKSRGYRSLATVHEHLRNLEGKFWIARRFNGTRAITCLVDLDVATRGIEAVVEKYLPAAKQEVA